MKWLLNWLRKDLFMTMFIVVGLLLAALSFFDEQAKHPNVAAPGVPIDPNENR